MLRKVLIYFIYILKLLEISYLKCRFCLNYIWLIQFIFYGIEMKDLDKNYEVEDFEELDDNSLDGNNEETGNAVDVKPKKYEPKFGMLFDKHHYLLISQKMKN